MKKLTVFLAFLLFAGFTVQAQMQISGTVTSAEDGLSIPGVSVVVKDNPTIGTTTDVDGKYSLTVPSGTEALMFSFVGLKTQEVLINGRSVIDVQIKAEILEMEQVVVTALGVTRQKKALGYSVQEVTGDAVNTAKDASFISSLSGKVAGVQIKKAGQIGGSVNVLIRGSNSFTGNNQALFVVDGVPISNDNSNTAANNRNGGGYDYGNAASDLDPESIESISVLKGATAAALYGSDAANGVILITTKKGSAHKDGIGISINQGVSFSSYEKKTFPEYQKEYGVGYGPYYSGGDHPGLSEFDFDGDGVDDLVVAPGEDASFGEAFDPNLMVYQWDSFFPQLDTYMQKSSWVAADNGPETLFKTGVGYTTNVSLDGGNEEGTFRLSYTNDDRTGIMENSKIKKDILDFNASYKITDKFTIDGKMTYTHLTGKGRYGTGYSGNNTMQTLRQWFQANVDLQDQKDAYMSTGDNITWNSKSPTNTDPNYSDNPYWTIYENYETDERNRTFGKFQGSYDLTQDISFTGRFGLDTYTDLREERIAIGSKSQSRYEKYERNFQEYNYDLFTNYDKRFESLSLNVLLGLNIKDKYNRSTRSETTGGLVVPRVYALSNSKSALEPAIEQEYHIIKYGYYGQVSLGFMDFWYAEGSVRLDKTSTLPEDANTYLYPSASTSFVFSQLMDVPWLSFGKFRAGYAEVGNDAEEYKVKNTYTAGTSFNSSPMYFIFDTSNNPELKSEKTKEFELGLEMNFLESRVGFDVSYYDKKTIDQINTVQVPVATGYNFKLVNAGEMKNTGVELGLFAIPVKTRDFQWGININWSKNKNEVVSLYEDSKNLLIYSNWSTAINARVGQPYGTITGTNFVYLDGKKVIGDDGKYAHTESTEDIIGNIQPDWNAGVSSNLSYKGVSLGFLIDIQQGGDVISWDNAFGLATGLYAETAGLNELGNPKRDPVADGGGILLDGVQADGTVNTIRAEAGDYTTPLGSYGGTEDAALNGDGNAPDALFLFDASYVKLREVTIEYKVPSSIVEKLRIFEDLSLSIYGRNLWIISKNLPHGDPEYNVGSGNNQGIINAALPSTKVYGFNIKVKL